MGKRRFPNIPSRRAARSHPNRIVSILFFDLSTNNLTLTFGKGVDAALRGVLAQRSVMMMMMVILRRGRRFPHAAHQRQGAPDPSSSSAAASSTPAGGARRHSAALKHPEQPCRHVRLGHALIPRGQEGVLRPFPPLPPIHLSLPPSSIPPGSDLTRIRGYRSVPADLSPRSYRPCTMPRYHIYKLSRGDRFLLLLLPSIRARKARISSLSLSLSSTRFTRYLVSHDTRVNL